MARRSSRSPVQRAFDYYRREGLRSLVGRMGQEFRQRTPIVERNRARLPQRVMEVLPPAIFGNLDLPSEDVSESSASLSVAGWAWSHDGIESIDLQVDGALLATTSTTIHRPDVAGSVSNEAGAATSGFAVNVPIAALAEGPHELSVIARDRSGTTRTFTRRFIRVSAQTLYHSYYEDSLPSEDELLELRRTLSATSVMPSFWLLLDGARDGDLAASVRSIRSQGYPAIRCLILASDARRPWIEAQLAVADGAGEAPRIEVVEELPLSARDEGDAPSFYGALLPGEELAPGALWVFAKAATTPEVDVIYSDHDVLLSSGRHLEPSFKPDWAPDHLLSRDYVGPSYLVRHTARLHELLREVLPGRGEAWRFDLLLRATDGPTTVLHVPRVLWSVPSSRGAPWMDGDEELAAVRSAMDRRGHQATVEATPERPGVRRVRWQPSSRPKVSIIIPTTGRLDYLRPCLDSLRTHTAYEDYEVLLIDNGRGRNRDGIEYARSLGVGVLTRDEPFNWAKLNNDGVRETDGPLLLFLNDDVEIVNAEWLDEMVSQATRADIGTVGSMLLYPSGRIQHAGVVLVGHGGGAMHLFHDLDPNASLYMDLQAVTREVAASTGACLMVPRDRFEEIGGFDEDLAIVGNDVDLCLRLGARGCRNVWTPHSVLIHHESVSRGPIAIGVDEQKIWDRWSDVLVKGDPFSNPNFDPIKADCSIDWKRISKPISLASARTSPGLNLIGYIRAEMGLGEAARGYAHAMSEAGVPFAVVDYSSGNPARMGDDSWVHKATTSPPYGTNLIHINASLIRDAVGTMPVELFAGRYAIGYWAWELPEFPDEWLGAFDVVDEVWVPSAFVQDSISRKSPVPVVRIPHAVKIPTGPFLPRSHFGLADDAYTFVTMYDGHSVRERKNPDAVVRAFKDAFGPDDRGVSLVIKVNGAASSGASTVGEWTEGYANIRVVDQILTRHEVDSLLARSDCFVSLHRSEGFGLPIAEAMGLAKPVIATYWSGNVDFMRPKSAACIDYELVTLDRDYGPYRAGQHWAEPDIDHAAGWMRRLAEAPDLGHDLGRVARSDVQTQLAPAVIGAIIKERLRHVPPDRRRGTAPAMGSIA